LVASLLRLVAMQSMVEPEAVGTQTFQQMVLGGVRSLVVALVVVVVVLLRPQL